MFRSALALSLCMSFLFLASCEELEDIIPSGDDKTETYYGSSVTVGEGTARAWVKIKKDGKPAAIGMNVSAEAVESLAEQSDEVFSLPLPEQAEATPFKALTLDWNSMGHPEVYFVPHFDVHFYMISDAERAEIAGGPQEHTAAFQENYMPASYTSGMFAVPNMGVHWEDLSEPQHHEEGFTKTFIYGSNNNEVIFFEPMVAVSYLQDLAPDDLRKMNVTQAPKVQKSGYYPSAYTIKLNSGTGDYSVALTDMQYRKAE